MESIWKELEEETKTELNTHQKSQVFSMAIRFFLEKHVKMTKIDGVSYVANPDKYRKALLRYFYLQMIGNHHETREVIQQE